MRCPSFSSLTTDNLPLATSLAHEIFPYEISSKGIFLPGEMYKLSLTKERRGKQQFFIVKVGKVPVGITGYNFHYRKPNPEELWLQYFGVVPAFLGNGLGKKMLLETLRRMKLFNLDLRTVKLYTSNCPEEIGSHHLYRCVGFRVYAHRKVESDQIYYFKLEI